MNRRIRAVLLFYLRLLSEKLFNWVRINYANCDRALPRSMSDAILVSPIAIFVDTFFAEIWKFPGIWNVCCQFTMSINGFTHVWRILRKVGLKFRGKLRWFTMFILMPEFFLTRTFWRWFWRCKYQIFVGFIDISELGWFKVNSIQNLKKIESHSMTLQGVWF